MELGGQWLSLMEYATRKSVSLSTLRRHIKAQKVRFRVENGRYLIWNQEGAPQYATEISDDTLTELRLQLQKAREEIAELKTLVAFYEEHHEGLHAQA